jgi:hypothetical protein
MVTGPTGMPMPTPTLLQAVRAAVASTAVPRSRIEWNMATSVKGELVRL